MSVKPIRDFLVVKVEAAKEEKVGGGLLYKPATVEDKVVTGTVLAVGSGQISANGTSIPLEVKAGDKVVFNKHLAVEVKEEGESYLLLREEHVVCVLA